MESAKGVVSIVSPTLVPEYGRLLRLLLGRISSAADSTRLMRLCPLAHDQVSGQDPSHWIRLGGPCI